MENATRKSNRKVKPRIEEGFDYDESLNFLSNGTDQCQVVAANSESAISATNPGKSRPSNLTWADINLPLCDIVPKREFEQIGKKQLNY